ncbi:MAG: penicillin-binding protein 2 [Deltaproteobacteria bacterium]|nr:penicillin-binding protein 2 [Deltaproteobacteria bacterium]
MALGSEVQSRNAVKWFRGRLLIASGLIALAFMGLIARLYDLQITRGDDFATRGQANFIKQFATPHDRGIIYDRNSRILVDNRPSLNVEVTPYFLGNREKSTATLNELYETLGVADEAAEKLSSEVFSKQGLNRFVAVRIKRDISLDEVEKIESQRSILKLDGVEIVEAKRRTYPSGSLAGHLLGYVNEIGRGRLNREKKRDNPNRYKRGDTLGRSGIEHQHEERLRGSDGYAQKVVDAKGRLQSADYMNSAGTNIDDKPAEPGHNIILTIDSELQKIAEESFDGRAGSVVVMDVETGEILAMVSKPGYDPNLISGAMALDEKARLDSNILKPWINRPIQGQYAPGSTFKVVTAMAALTQGYTTPSEEVFCPGYYRLGGRNWRCHKDSGHGHVNLKEALKVSCDTYFYALSVRMGINEIAKAGSELGLGSQTGIELRGEKRGLMPDEAFHDRVEKSTGGYQKGMALNTSIGQGSVLTTPLQMAVIYAAMANGGKMIKPQLVKRIETADFRVWSREFGKLGEVEQKVEGREPEVIFEMKAEIKSRLNLDPAELAAIQEGLIAVAQEPGGTAYWRRSRLVTMAGKTGTAQVIRLGVRRDKAEDMEYFARDHAWFAAYAPIENPEIAVVVLNEHSGHGGSKAGPIAVSVIDAWHTLKENRRANPRLTENENEVRP